MTRNNQIRTTRTRVRKCTGTWRLGVLRVGSCYDRRTISSSITNLTVGIPWVQIYSRGFTIHFCPFFFAKFPRPSNKTCCQPIFRFFRALADFARAYASFSTAFVALAKRGARFIFLRHLRSRESSRVSLSLVSVVSLWTFFLSFGKKPKR